MLCERRQLSALGYNAQTKVRQIVGWDPGLCCFDACRMAWLGNGLQLCPSQTKTSLGLSGIPLTRMHHASSTVQNCPMQKRCSRIDTQSPAGI